VPPGKACQRSTPAPELETRIVRVISRTGSVSPRSMPRGSTSRTGLEAVSASRNLRNRVLPPSSDSMRRASRQGPSASVRLMTRTRPPDAIRSCMGCSSAPDSPLRESSVTSTLEGEAPDSPESRACRGSQPAGASIVQRMLPAAVFAIRNWARPDSPGPRTPRSISRAERPSAASALDTRQSVSAASSAKRTDATGLEQCVMTGSWPKAGDGSLPPSLENA